MSAKLEAFTFIRCAGLIERASEVKYLGSFGGDHIFGRVDGSIIAVDLALGSFRVNGRAK